MEIVILALVILSSLFFTFAKHLLRRKPSSHQPRKAYWSREPTTLGEADRSRELITLEEIYMVDLFQYFHSS